MIFTLFSNRAINYKRNLRVSFLCFHHCHNPQNPPRPKTMPTLVEQTNSRPALAPAVADPSELTLTIGGVTFSLVPSDNDAGISYKRIGQEVFLSLSSFTGSLKVSSLKGGAITTADSPTHKKSTATVEVESPVSPSAPKAKQGNSSQTKLSFIKKTSTKKTNKERKRTVELVLPSASAKKSRKTITNEHPNLGQTEKPTQEASQTQPDLSQTMSSQTDDAGMSSNSLMQQQERTQSSGASEAHSSTSVRDILDRVNSSNDDDSVATVPMEDDDDSVSSEKSPQDKTEPESAIAMDEHKNSFEAKESTAESPSANPRVHPSPTPRWGHSMTKINDEKVLVYGGQSFDLEGNPVMLDDVHVYDMANGSWNKPIQCRGDMRQWHSSTYLPEVRFFVCCP